MLFENMIPKVIWIEYDMYELKECYNVSGIPVY